MNHTLWGLHWDITPQINARLVQEENRLHYLADRAGIIGRFSEAESEKLENIFPHFISQMESMLATDELDPRDARRVTLIYNGFICVANTLGSYGYVYIVIYPVQN